MKATLILENGMVFHGEQIGAEKECMFRLVCNSSMTGYQEMLTNPVYRGKGIVMTYPLIGNYGVCEGDDESAQAHASALVVRNLIGRGSNFRSTDSLDAYLKKNMIPGISRVDTRALTRMLRRDGTMNAMITFAESFSVEEKVSQLKQFQAADLVQQVTCKETWRLEGAGPKLAVLDLGLTNSVIKALEGRQFDLTVFPAFTKGEALIRGEFDGIVLSGGPGDPRAYGSIVEELKKVYASSVPVFAMGLGHQLIALAVGMEAETLSYGHHGNSHPVLETNSGRVFITAQNHDFAVKTESVDNAVAAISYVHVNDQAVEGLIYKRPHLTSVQFVPETQAVSYGMENPYDRFLKEISALRS